MLSNQQRRIQKFGLKCEMCESTDNVVWLWTQENVKSVVHLFFILIVEPLFQTEP